MNRNGHKPPAVHPRLRCSSSPSASLFTEIPQISSSVSSLKKEQLRVTNSFSQRADTSVRQPLPSESSLVPSPCLHQSHRSSSSQINRDSGGHSWSLPPRSEPRWGRTHSSHPPSPPGLWCHQTAPRRRCPWSARWRRAQRWWRHGPTSRRSASRTPLPASLPPGGSPGAVPQGHTCGPPIGRRCCGAGRDCEPPPANRERSGKSGDWWCRTGGDRPPSYGSKPWWWTWSAPDPRCPRSAAWSAFPARSPPAGRRSPRRRWGPTPGRSDPRWTAGSDTTCPPWSPRWRSAGTDRAISPPWLGFACLSVAL